MPRTRKRKRHSSIIPGPLKKGIRDINKVTSRVARGIDHYPQKALTAIAGQVLKQRKFPGLGGGYMSKAARQLRNPGVYGAVKTAKKGGRKRRGGSRKRRAGSRKRRGGSRKRRGGSRKRR